MAVLQALMMGTSTTKTVVTGELWTWGRNHNGQLSQGDTTDPQNTPERVGSLTNWQNTFASDGDDDAMMVIKDDGTLWGWGNNSSGELGDGTTTNRSSPVQIGSGTDWSEVCNSAATGHAIKTDGTMWSCGEGYYGTLGHSDSWADISSPLQIGSDTDWLHVMPTSSGYRLAIKTTGTLWYWGKTPGVSSGYQYGPAQIGSATDWTDVRVTGGGAYNSSVYAIKAV